MCPANAPICGVRRARLELGAEFEDEPGEDAADKVAGGRHEEGQTDDPPAQVGVGLLRGRERVCANELEVWVGGWVVVG
jgi:hypothetical protein